MSTVSRMSVEKVTSAGTRLLRTTSTMTFTTMYSAIGDNSNYDHNLNYHDLIAETAEIVSNLALGILEDFMEHVLASVNDK